MKQDSREGELEGEAKGGRAGEGDMKKGWTLEWVKQLQSSRELQALTFGVPDVTKTHNRPEWQLPEASLFALTAPGNTNTFVLDWHPFI